MKAFIWAVVACVVISVGAGVIFVGFESDTPGSRVTSSVRLG